MLGDDAALPHDQDAVGGLQRLLHIAGGDEDGSGRVHGTQRSNEIMTRAEIDALKRFVEQQQCGRPCLPAGDHDLLLIAAGKMVEPVTRSSADDPQAPDGGDGGGAFAAETQEAEQMRPLLQMRQSDGPGEVGAERRGGRQRRAPAIFTGHEDAGGDGVRRSAAAARARHAG